MNDIRRHIDDEIESHFTRHERQILLLLGARQVGKTTLLKRLFPDTQYFLMDNDPVRKNFETYDINSYQQFIRPDSTVIIDEIQLLSDPGRAAKIIYDQMLDVKLIITGSSALHIKNQSAESLAGRKIDYHLYPLTFAEYMYQTGAEKEISASFLPRIINEKPSPGVHLFDLRSAVQRILTYGLNPYLVNHPENSAYLKEHALSAIFKDIIELDLIEHRKVAADLLKLLAYQIGNLINYNELAVRLGVDARTVKRYVSIFEQSFIIFRLEPFTARRRDEIGKASKIYFYDVGIRNAVIGDFSDPFPRRDFGALFENFIVSEAVKHNTYSGSDYQLNFWRTTQGAEVDLVLHKNDKIIGCEIKSSGGRVSSAFLRRHPDAKPVIITMENFY